MRVSAVAGTRVRYIYIYVCCTRCYAADFRWVAGPCAALRCATYTIPTPPPLWRAVDLVTDFLRQVDDSDGLAYSSIFVPTGGGGIGQGGLPYDQYWLAKAKKEIAVVSE